MRHGHWIARDNSSADHVGIHGEAGCDTLSARHSRRRRRRKPVHSLSVDVRLRMILVKRIAVGRRRRRWRRRGRRRWQKRRRVMVVLERGVDAGQRKFQILHRTAFETLALALLRGGGVRAFVAVRMLPVVLMTLPVRVRRGGARVRAGRVRGADAGRTRPAHVRQQEAVRLLRVIGGVLVQRHSHVAVGRVGDAGDEVTGGINGVGRVRGIRVRVEVLIDHRLAVTGGGSVVRWRRAREIINRHHRGVRGQAALKLVLRIVGRELDRRVLVLMATGVVDAGSDQRFRGIVALAISTSPVHVVLLILLLLLLLRLLLRLLVALLGEHVSG